MNALAHVSAVADVSHQRARPLLGTLVEIAATGSDAMQVQRPFTLSVHVHALDRLRERSRFKARHVRVSA